MTRLMMATKNITLTLTLFASLLTGCEAPSPPAAPAVEPKAAATPEVPPPVSAEFSGKIDWDATTDAKGDVWVAFRDLQNQLLLQRLSAPGEPETRVIDTPQHQVSEARLLASAEGMEFLWRPKAPRKELKYGRLKSDDGFTEPFSTVIGFASQPLPEYHLWARDTLRVAVWQGEATVEGDDFNYYLNYSLDGGETWGEEQLLGPGRILAPLLSGDELVLFLWSPSGKDRFTITQRTFHFDRRDLLAEKHSEGVPFMNPSLQAVESGGRWLLVWPTQRGWSADTQVIEGMYSDDRGASWTQFTLTDTDGLNPGPLQLLADGRGNLMLAFYALNSKTPGAKSDLFLFRSRDNGASWKPLKHLRAAEASKTKARDLVAHYDPPTGEVVLAWQDYRDILTNVFVARTSDWGDSWSEPIPIGRPGTDRLGLNQRQPSILRTETGRKLIIEEYTNERFSRKRLQLVDLDRVLTEAKVPAPHPNRNPEALKARISSYWEAVKKGDYAAAYDLLDPTYRAVVSKSSYVEARGRIQYHAAEIQDLGIEGSVATVTMRIDAEVPPFEAKGGATFSSPREERKIEERWLFIGNDWYREYFDDSNQTSYISY